VRRLFCSGVWPRKRPTRWRNASPRVDLPGFYPAVYPGFVVRDCLSRTSTESSSAGTLEAHLIQECKQYARPAAAGECERKSRENRHGAHVGDHRPATPSTVNSHQVGATMPQFRSSWRGMLDASSNTSERLWRPAGLSTQRADRIDTATCRTLPMSCPNEGTIVERCAIGVPTSGAARQHLWVQEACQTRCFPYSVHPGR
jgi:hypothetical protein